MSKTKGGNPFEDSREAVIRFETVVEPTFRNQGFRRMDKRSQILINDTTKSIVFVTSAPSQPKLVGYYTNKVKLFKKQLEGYSSYILFTRDSNEWNDKPTYVNIMKRTMNIGGLKGVVSGLDKLPRMISKVKDNSQCYLID